MSVEPTTAAPAASTANRYAALAKAITRGGTGDAAALARLDPDGALQPHQIAAAVRAFLAAGIEPEGWSAAQWQRWSLIAHGIALAGHDGGRSLGWQLAKAGVAESRVTKLLTARGDAFSALIPRLLRLLASKAVAPNWNEMGALIHQQALTGADAVSRAEEIRLRIASRYFAAASEAPNPAA